MLPPRITLRADPAMAVVAPVLAPSIGLATILLDQTLTYPADYLLCERMSFDGGTYGIHCGASSPQSHALTLTGCKFVGQSLAAIYARSMGSVLDVNVSECDFVGSGQLANGIEVRMISINCVQNIEVVGCRFRGLAAGILTAGDTYFSVDGGHMDATIRRSDFSDCDIGMHLRHPPQLSTTGSYLVTGTRVAGCNIGIAINGPYHSGHKVLVVDDCWIHSCGTGIIAGGYGLVWEGVTIELRSTTIAGCALGTQLFASYGSYNWVFATDVTWSDNSMAFQALTGGDGYGVGVDLQR